MVPITAPVYMRFKRTVPVTVHNVTVIPIPDQNDLAM
jgi:hypothetical protein